MIVTVTDENEAGAISLDTARPKMGDPPTATLTDPDGVTDGTVTWKWERSAGRNTWVVIDGAEAASYTPAAADTGAYLRVTATYTDSHAADQSARAVSAEVVAAELLKPQRDDKRLDGQPRHMGHAARIQCRYSPLRRRLHGHGPR